MQNVEMEQFSPLAAELELRQGILVETYCSIAHIYQDTNQPGFMFLIFSDSLLPFCSVDSLPLLASVSAPIVIVVVYANCRNSSEFPGRSDSNLRLPP